jgi:beta-galactosidase
MYQSEWTNKPVLHIFPHWNWKKGDTIDVWAYYNQADEVELWLNGKSLGVKGKQGDDLHVWWRVIYEPGTLKAVSRKNGQEVLSREIKTAGKAASIILTVDRDTIHADGNDLSFVTAKIVDADGNLVPSADNLIQFSSTGAGSVVATDNGSETSMESFQSPDRKTFHGLCLAVVRSSSQTGTIVLTAKSEGMTGATVSINVKEYFRRFLQVEK